MAETKRICSVEGCDRASRSGINAYCEMHYYRVRRHGDAAVRNTTAKPLVKYRAAHARVHAAMGRATDRACVDCGNAADHWSYMHDDPNELTSDTGQPYSLNPRHYEPRCAACHARFDGTGANQYSKR